MNLSDIPMPPTIAPVTRGRMICESCDHGYSPTASICPWCNASATLAHVSDVTACMDTECYIDYWLIMFDTGGPGGALSYQLAPDHPMDIHGLRRTLSQYRLATFNGNHYDMPLIALALAGCDNATLKSASDAIIIDQLQPWQLLDRFGVQALDWVDHIDVFDVAPGMGSLKMYGGKMHSKRLQDLPYPPDTRIDWPKRIALREYCRNDLRITRDLLEAMKTQIELREQMSAEYGIDLRSKSDAQIAEAVMKSILPFKPERPLIPAGSQFYYRPPEWLQFVELDLLRLLARSPFTINAAGYADMTAELANTVVRIGQSAYALGSGGLHSTESKIVHRADAEYSLVDIDVRGYYPSMILRLRIYPQQIGEIFQSIYRGWKESRDKWKNIAEDKSQPPEVRKTAKKNANSGKTLGNGTFGKLLSKWSIFYAPSEGMQVTISGQLALMMLIEMQELSGISVVSANTDGIVVKCRRDMEWLRDQIVVWWESITQFETERADYVLLASRDVNSYVAIRADGTVKLKGAYAPPEPGPSGWPNPTGQICVDAVVAYLQHGTPMENTICACQDVRQFIYLRQVKGGGSYAPAGLLPARTTQKEMRAVIAAEYGDAPTGKDALLAAYDDLRQRVALDHEYLGKAVRWYYARGSRGCIVTPAGGLVARTQGCRPLMELPDALPGDIDYEWYVSEARSLLADLGVMG